MKYDKYDMEKLPLPSRSPCQRKGSMELQCVGKLEIVRAKPPIGFLCGSIPVLTDKTFTAFDSALIRLGPAEERAPRYRVIPTETNLKTLPLRQNIPEKVLPMVANHSRTGGDLPYEAGAITSNLRRKGEALAVSGLSEYGDEIDVIAPADILKQIFKIPYSRARLSIAVHRIGQTLVLNTGPDVDEGEKLVRRHKQSQCAEKSLILNFAMHSVRMEACDCPSAQNSESEEQPKSSFLPGNRDTDHAAPEGYTSPCFGQHNDIAQEEVSKCSEYSQAKHDGFFWGGKMNKRNKGHDGVKEVSHVKEKPRSSMQESDKYQRTNHDGFLRVLFWKFNNYRMLLGSDLLIFSNEKYVAVSLHLWDVSRQVTPLIWLEAWLDNVMASVPELAICYHQNGVVQGYELLKTDDIFLSKGVSEDGSPAFYPHVVQQNGHSVLRFLQENCKQDPGAYWLYKNAGEDNIQLFDLSVIPKSHAAENCDDDSTSIPSLIHRGRSDSLLSLGTLLYRIAHRLSLSVSPHNRQRCASFFKKCLDFLDQPDQLVVRAFAHEQFARLLLDYDEDLNLTSEVMPVDSGATVINTEEKSYECSCGISELIVQEICNPDKEGESGRVATVEDSGSEGSLNMPLRTDASVSRKLVSSNEAESGGDVTLPTCDRDTLELSVISAPVVQANVNSIFSKLVAIHHVSQAIKSLRWKRQLQGTDNNTRPDHAAPVSIDFSVCACGDADCIEVCDIREWLLTSKLDDKLCKLVLLLGESYLALGEAYKDEDQLHQAFKVVQLACLVYGSMPQHLEDMRFVSSMSRNSSFEIECDRKGITKSVVSHYLFWAKAWTLVADVYVKFYLRSDEKSVKTGEKPLIRELKMSPEVQKELERLKKKLGKLKQNCSSCSLVNCSCQSDRASSGSSASSSSGDTRPFNHGRKQCEKTLSKSLSYSLVGKQEDAGNAITQNVSTENDVLKSSIEAESVSTETKVKKGGIFRYLHGYVQKDADHYLSAALHCYEEARKSLSRHPCSSSELQSLLKKKGWVCNELGRRRLEEKEMAKAELAFADAISSFKKVSDHSNIILINCNLGHGRRAVAEEMVSQMEFLRKHLAFHNAHNQKLEAAKSEYCESLKYYRAAKKELDAIDGEGNLSNNLKNEVYTQFAHTYLRLGMLLARENSTAKVYKAKTEFGKHEISANDAISEALSMYELLGDMRKQEAAYAYFQLACYHRDCCLRLLETDAKKGNAYKGEKSVLVRVKQYSSMAERNWQKSIQFYGPKTHSTMYLTILVERSALSFSLSRFSNSNLMLELALNGLLEACHVSEDKIPDSLRKDDSKVYEKFCGQLQMLLKRMLTVALSDTPKKPSASSQQNPPGHSGYIAKLKDLYRLSLKARDFSQLHAIQRLWVS